MHAITGRAKYPESLRKKLLKREVDLAGAVDEAVKDLAGVRIVFLTNEEIGAFNGTYLLRENFEIISVNVHHAVPGTETETKLFDSTNYLVRLRPERLALAEYKPFEGLRAEIQVQTLLNHAWAEMGHDTIYKQPDLHNVGQKRLEAIRDRLDRVMREHLLPAGRLFLLGRLVLFSAKGLVDGEGHELLPVREAARLVIIGEAEPLDLRHRFELREDSGQAGNRIFRHAALDQAGILDFDQPLKVWLRLA